MRIVVVGGLGDLGLRVVRELADRGHAVSSASRRTGVDLRTGAGLRDAFAGVDAVVHCATDPTRSRAVDVAGTRLLVDAVTQEGLRRSAPAPHVVSVSIVGCDRVPYGYYRSKMASEQVLEHSGIPATVVRATQFHALAAFMAKLLRLGPLGLSVGDLRLQPVDIDWVAARLADHAEGPSPAGLARATDLAGPAASSLDGLQALVAQHDDRAAPRPLRIPPVGAAMRAVSSGALLPSPAAELGGRSFADWLAEQPRPLPRRMHHQP